MQLNDKIEHALTGNPSFALAWFIGFTFSFGALIVLLIAMRRYYNRDWEEKFSVAPIKIPTSDALGLLCALTWLKFFSVTNLLFPMASIVGIIWLLKRHGIDPHRQWGTGKVSALRLPVLALWLCLASMGLIAPISWALETIAARMHWDAQPQEAVEFLLGTNNRLEIVWLLFAAIVLAPFSEEILFRGFLQPFLKSIWSPRAAWVGTAAIFAAIHFHAMSFPQLFVLGLILGAAYEFTGSLALSIGIHLCFNGITAAWLLLLKSVIA